MAYDEMIMYVLDPDNAADTDAELSSRGVSNGYETRG